MTRFFDYQYLWKEATRVLDFLYRDNNQRKIVFKTTTAGWMLTCMPSHAQTCVILPGVNLVSLRLIWP